MDSIRRFISSRRARVGLWLALVGAGAVPLLLDALPSAPSGSASSGPVAAGPPVTERPLALVLEVDGPIGPATTNYFDKGIRAARERGAEIVVIEMNTPGGLLESTRDIISRMIRSPVPVAVYVSPPGSRAASAGTFLLYASHVAAMAPSTTMGAATPVRMGAGQRPSGDGATDTAAEGREVAGAGVVAPSGQLPTPQEPAEPGERPTGMEEKAIEDAVAYIRSLAEMRGRNEEWAERAVREAATVTNREAVEQNIVDLQADDVRQLLEAVDGRTVVLGDDDREVTLATADAEIEYRPPDRVDRFLGLITNPNVAFLFMILGVYGLIFELSNPGALVPGVLGGISLMIGLYALNVLPINHAGLGLLLLGMGLMVAEVFAPSFGVLGVGGLIAFGLGAMMLFDIDDPAFQLSPWTVGIMTALTGLVLIVVIGYLYRSHARPVASGNQVHLVGRRAEVHDWSDGGGRVIVQGELWNAEGPEGLEPGQEVWVEEVSGLRLTVASTAPAESAEQPGR